MLYAKQKACRCSSHFLYASSLRLRRHLFRYRITLSTPPFDEADAVRVFIILVVPRVLAAGPTARIIYAEAKEVSAGYAGAAAALREAVVGSIR